MENFLTELTTLLLNGVSPAQYVASFIMVCMGITASLLQSAKKRKTEDGQNPVPFSKSYLIVNNLQRIAASLLACFVLVRFFNTAVDPNVTILLAAGLGYSSDATMNMLRKLESKAPVKSEEN